MNTITNIIKKDLRQNRFVLLAWVALVLGHFGIRCLQIKEPFASGLGSWLRFFNSTSRPDLALLMVLPVLLIPLIMHADPVRKRLAFWRSLPVARGSLLTAKALLVCAVFVVFPLLVEVLYFMLAGLQPVLAESLKIWLLLHVPVVATLYLLCYLTPGWKSYLCLVVPFLGFGLPLPGMFKMLNDVGMASLARNWNQTELPVIKLPDGASWQVLPETVISGAEAIIEGKGSEKRTTEVVSGRFDLEISGLPKDVVGSMLYCDGAEWVLDNGQRVKIGTDFIRVEYENKYQGIRGSGQMGPTPPLGEFAGGADVLGPIPVENQYLLRVEWKDVPCEFAQLPVTGGTLKGIVRMRLAKKHQLKELPLKDGLEWRDGLRSMTIRKSDWGSDRRDSRLFFDLDFLRPMSTLVPAATEIDHQRFPECFLWLEHRNHPLGQALGCMGADRFLSASGADQKQSDLSRNLVFEKNRLEYHFSGLTENEGRDRSWELPFREFVDGAKSWDQWRLTLKAYDSIGVVEIPFEVRLPKPYRLLTRELNSNLTFNVPIKGTMFTAELRAIQLTANPTVQEAEEAFFRLTALAGADYLWDSQRAPRANFVEDNKIEIDRLLRQIYRISPRPLVAGSWRTEVAMRHRREGYQDYVWYDGDGVVQWFNGGLWGWKPPKTPGYWFLVNKVVETESKPADKDLILAHLRPGLDQVPTLERHGWLDEALPQMCRIAMREPVSESWFQVLRTHPSAQTKRALLAQVRQHVQPFGRMMELFSSGWSDAECQELAELIWQTAFRRANSVRDLRGALAVALKYGIADAPHNLKLAVNYNNGLMEMQGYEPDEILGWQRSLIQTMALWSDCPEELEDGSEWLLEHGDDLKWNADRRRYEIPGSVSDGKPNPLVAEVADWGKWIDPLGVSRVTRQGPELTIRSSAVPTDYYEAMTCNFAPRILREVTGDFTMEVTVAPRFTPSESWSNSGGDPFQSGGLLIEVSPWDWLRLDNLMFGEDGNRRVGESLIKGLRPVFESSDPPNFDPSQPVSLQIRRHGDLFVSAWRQGGGAWHEFTGHRLHQWPKTVRIGVLSINKNMLPFESVFSGFNVLPTAEPPANLDAPETLNPPERMTRDGDDLGIFGKAGNISGAGVFELKDRRLTIATQPHTSDFNPTHWDNAPRALQEVKGDFSFEVTIDPPSQGKGWTCPNLMIADAEKRIYFRAGPIFDGSRTYFNAFLKVNTQYSYMPWIGGDFDHARPIRVRLKREGVKFTVATKGEGREWLECAPFLVSGCQETLQVGVLSLNVSDQMATAGFEDPVLRVGDGN